MSSTPTVNRKFNRAGRSCITWGHICQEAQRLSDDRKYFVFMADHDCGEERGESVSTDPESRNDGVGKT